MLSNELLQSIIQDFSIASGLAMALYNGHDVRVACFPDEINNQLADSESMKFTASNNITYELHIEKQAQSDSHKWLALTAGQIIRLYELSENVASKETFFQLLLKNELSKAQYYRESKQLHIAMKKERMVFCIAMKGENGEDVMAVVKGLFGKRPLDIAFFLDDRYLIYVRTIEGSSTSANDVAGMLRDMINAEAFCNVVIGYGNPKRELSELAVSYEEAKMAVEIGQIFYEGTTIFSYQKLGIGRLLYELSESLCRLFLEEVLKGKRLTDLDAESLQIIDKFFENNLNISETARQLYLHRNTLIYRLEKITREIGLDIRKFDDAVTLKVALMVENQIIHHPVEIKRGTEDV